MFAARARRAVRLAPVAVAASVALPLLLSTAAVAQAPGGPTAPPGSPTSAHPTVTCRTDLGSLAPLQVRVVQPAEPSADDQAKLTELRKMASLGNIDVVEGAGGGSTTVQPPVPGATLYVGIGIEQKDLDSAAHGSPNVLLPPGQDPSLELLRRAQTPPDPTNIALTRNIVDGGSPHVWLMPVKTAYITLREGKTVACPADSLSLPFSIDLGDGAPHGDRVLAVMVQSRDSEDLLSTVPLGIPQSSAALTAKKGGGGIGSTPLILIGVVVVAAAAFVASRYPTWVRDRAAVAVGPAPPGTGPPSASMPVGAAAPPPPLPARYTESPAFEHRPPPPPAPGWTGAIPGGATVRLEDLGLMRITARNGQQGRGWSHESNRWLLAGGWVEKVSGKGEDAEPAMRIHRSGVGVLGVFDGTGGAGAASARLLPDGTDLSGAYVASRLAKEVTEAWGTETLDRGSGPSDPDQLRDRLQRALTDETTYPDVPRSTMKGSLQRVLPTTLAATVFRVGEPAVSVDAAVGGRLPGLRSHPRPGPAGADHRRHPRDRRAGPIRNDQPMSNLVCADRPFVINHRRYEIDQPVVLLAATDGCFGYVRTPAHFEHLLLDTMARASGTGSWTIELVESLAAIAADDCSFSLGAFGFGSFEQMQGEFARRLDYLTEVHWAPFTKNVASKAESDALADRSWEAYRDLYHGLVEGVTT